MNRYEIFLVDLDDSSISVIVEQETLHDAVLQAFNMSRSRERNICLLRTVVVNFLESGDE